MRRSRERKDKFDNKEEGRRKRSEEDKEECWVNKQNINCNKLSTQERNRTIIKWKYSLYNVPIL